MNVGRDRRPDRAPIGISVVIPSLNQGRFIDDAIRSLLDQNYPNLEILVMDGGSTDDTLDRIIKFGDQLRWNCAKDAGQADAIIRGFAQTTKPWLTWLNSDDVQCNDALWKVDETIAAKPHTDVVVGRAHYMDESGANPRPYPTIDFVLGDIRQKIFDGGYMAQPSVFFHRNSYERVGGLNCTLKYCMDYDLWARFATAGMSFVGIAEDISGNRWYPSTKTAGQTLELYGEVLATQRSLFGAVSPYYVQAVSDYLYTTLHAQFLGNKGQLLFRWLYFKSLWLVLNAPTPTYCLKGLLFQTIAKSGPIVGDRLTLKEWLSLVASFRRTTNNDAPKDLCDRRLSRGPF